MASDVAEVTQPDKAARLVQAAVAAVGDIDIGVNNVDGGGRVITDSTDEEWRATLDIHLPQTVRMLRLISGWALQLVGSGQNGAAKAALIFDAERSALEFVPHGVRMSVGSILVEGDGWDRYRLANQTNYDDYVRRGFPMGRLGTAEEVAAAIGFLALPRTHWINGQNIAVDRLEQPDVPAGPAVGLTL